VANVEDDEFIVIGEPSSAGRTGLREYGVDLCVARKPASAHLGKALLDRVALLFTEPIHAGSARLNVARDICQFLLIFFRPGGNVLQDFFDLRTHEINIAQLSDLAILRRRRSCATAVPGDMPLLIGRARQILSSVPL
jgi:hypothetical protein